MRRAERACASQRRSQGFTMIEVMIALAILGFGLLAMAVMQIQAMSGGRAGRHTTQAAVIARDQMEQFQRLAWADPLLVQTAGWTAPVAVNNVPDGGGGVEQTYAVTWRVTDDATDPAWVKNIDIRVTWNEPGFPPKNLTISSTRYNDPW